MNIGEENEFIEFKKSTSEMKEGIISISSILNKHGKGTLYFGVSNSGDVTGQDIGKDTLRNVSREIAGNIKPSCWYEVNVRSSDSGKKFIEVNFSGDDAPYSAFGRFYERFADEDRAIPDTELERMFKSRKNDYSEWENELSSETSEDVDERFLKKYIAKGNEQNRIKYTFTDKDSIFTKLGLLDKKSKRLNNAGRVLFSNNKPVLLKIATFAGITKETFIKLDHFEGNVFECIDKGIEYILEGISWKVSMGADAARSEEPEIPVVAVREIVVNAFAHGNYSGNTAFEIDIFKDRVSIYSPGQFPRGYKPEDFSTMSEEPVMLNPKIINVLFKTGEIESFGTGFERAFNACKESGVEYRYIESGSGFRFEFIRPIGQKNVQDKKEKMSKIEMEVLSAIKENNFVTGSVIAKKINKSEKTVYRTIKKLKDAGMIYREGSAYNGKWRVINEVGEG